jgi:hypothetical protein
MPTARGRWIGVSVAILLLAFVAGSFLINSGIEETYSPGWMSAGTENARMRGVFVRSPIVVPAGLALGDSLEARVSDAWIERVTHVEYAWLFIRKEVRDSQYRLVLHLAQLPRGARAWSVERARCFVNADYRVNGEVPARTGNPDVDILYLQRTRPFPDTVRLAVTVTRGAGASKDCSA